MQLKPSRRTDIVTRKKVPAVPAGTGRTVEIRPGDTLDILDVPSSGGVNPIDFPILKEGQELIKSYNLRLTTKGTIHVITK